MNVIHNIPPIYNNSSKILILGSFPSVKSREKVFFYSHPQNRFWIIMERLFGVSFESIDDKKEFLLSQHIALWDVIASCSIKGSSDVSIAAAIPNDVNIILDSADIKHILCNGSKSFELYMKYIYPKAGIMPYKMPSTSPANASWSLDRLISSWKMVLDLLAS